MSEAADELRRLIKKKYAEAAKGDYFALLGVSRSASAGEVKNAYFALVKSVHPDRVNQLGLTDLRDEAGKLFQILTQAYNTLSDPRRRDEYLKGKLQAATPANPVTRQKVSDNAVEAAKIAFHKGSVMMTKRSYPEAENYFREATKANEDIARYWQSLGWAIFHNETRGEKERFEDARKCYEKALEIDDEDATTHYNVGLYWKAIGNMRNMRKAMEKAVECDPNFVEAKRELRLMKMREKKARADRGRARAATSSGIFSKLMDAFKKK